MLRQIFLLTSTSLTAYQYDGRGLMRMDCFVAADAGLASFDAYLQQLGQAPTYVLTDLVEEDFRIDSVAHVLGRDRTALLDRHSGRLYRGTAFRHAAVLGRDPHNKRKDEVLFSGLLNSEFMDLWLGAMRHHRVPVVGVYSLPLLSGDLVKRLCDKRADVLFVTHNGDSGLRQSFFSRGQLRFSRLTPVPAEQSDAEYAEYVGAEIAKTKRYLSNLHLLGRDVVLDVCVLSAGARLAALSGLDESAALTRFQLVDIATAAQRLRLGDTTDAPFCDELFVRLLARRRAPNHYASGQQRFHYQIFRARQALAVLGLAAAVGGVLWSGTQIVDGLMYRREAADNERLLAIAQQGYSEVESRLPVSDVAPEDMQFAVAAAERLQSQRKNPHTVLARLGQALQADPGLRLERIEWFVSHDPQATTAATHEDQAAAAQFVEYDAEGNPVEDAGGESGQRYQIGIAHGRVTPFDGDYSGAHGRIDGLLHALRARPDVARAEALELPLNTAVSGRVLGGVGDSESPQDAHFRLRLVLKDAHDPA